MTQPTASIETWGKDHWSTFAYIETRIVDHKGVLNPSHMRCDSDIHPQFGSSSPILGSKKYPTKLKGGVLLHDHDDWSCADDAEAVGFIENQGTGLLRRYVLTPLGAKVANDLRNHKAAGKNFADFEYRV